MLLPLKTYFLQSKYKLGAFLILLFFAIIYASISIVNHYFFRTYALDLGMYNQAIYNFSHLREAHFTLGLSEVEMPFLATHFSLITILYSPIAYLFGTYSLLIFQIGMIFFGAFYIYKYSLQFFDEKSTIPFFLVLHFLSIWGIFSALGFDYHDNVIGAMLVPAFVYYVEKRNLKVALFFLVLILISKEIMSLWVVFILLGLMLKNKDRFKSSYLKFEWPLLAIALIYGVIVIFYIMPHLQGVDQNLQFGRYLQPQSNVASIFNTPLSKIPNLIVDFLFRNTIGDPAYDHIKTETYIMFLISGGIFCFYKPQYLLMLIPIFALKFANQEYVFWGTLYQYSIEFVPIISFATMAFIHDLKISKRIVITVVFILTLSSTIYILNDRKSKWYNKTNNNFLYTEHYQTDINLDEVYHGLDMISPTSVVSASSSLVPRLAFRETIYHFPIIKNAEYIALFLNRDSYPLTPEEITVNIQKLSENKHYTILYHSKDLIIFQKLKP